MKRLYASVPEDTHNAVKSRSARDGEKLTKWVEKAVMDRLNPTGASRSAADAGPLAELSGKRRSSALRCVKFLKECPEEFSDALDAFLKSFVALERRVCHRK